MIGLWPSTCRAWDTRPPRPISPRRSHFRISGLTDNTSTDNPTQGRRRGRSGCGVVCHALANVSRLYTRVVTRWRPLPPETPLPADRNVTRWAVDSVGRRDRLILGRVHLILPTIPTTVVGVLGCPTEFVEIAGMWGHSLASVVGSKDVLPGTTHIPTSSALLALDCPVPVCHTYRT